VGRADPEVSAVQERADQGLHISVKLAYHCARV